MSGNSDSSDTGTLRSLKARFDYIIDRYIAVIAGWSGILAFFGWMFGAVSAEMAMLFLLFGSGIGALFGYHALAMGWLDE